jgi:hemerythrin
MHTMAIARGVHWVAIPDADLFILCGCPADSVKLLMKKGLILPTQKNGTSFETGPNAILLSDVPSQNETFSNLAEFPILQMLYRQGMIIPGHPGNTGRKPLLMGLESQVRSQSQYMLRGNYGLASEEEIVAAGAPREVARDYMRMKLWFAFGRIRAADELVETRILGDAAVELRGGATVRRTGFNTYEFAFKGDTASVDLNLAPLERYPSSYSLGYHKIRREYFSVVHIGEGDGWDTEKPCMGSIVTFQGRIYLIDAGPNIEQSLTAVGISVNEIEGIFHSHSHDDHFAGLTSLVRSDHRIKYFATPLVRSSVAKKLSALMDMDEAMFPRYFEVHDLTAGRWNNVNGLQVKLVISAHPVETKFFIFRALWEGGYRSYAHLADIVSLEVLSKMSSADPSAPGVSKAFAENLIAEMHAPADLKKIDADGEPIHGRAGDFRADESGRLIISHHAGELSNEQKEIGSNAVFGREDVLIPANVDYIAQSAFRFLRSYFPQCPLYSVRMLANCPLVYFNAGSIIIKKGERHSSVWLILQGVGEVVDVESGLRRALSAGAIVGELSTLMREPAFWTVRGESYITAVQIPSQLYLAFIQENRLEEATRRVLSNRRFLQDTWLFGEMLGYPVERGIAAAMEPLRVNAGDIVDPGESQQLFLVASGECDLQREGTHCETITRGGFWGEDAVLYATRIFHARAVRQADLFSVPGALLTDIPIVQWRLLQTSEKRLRSTSRGGA